MSNALQTATFFHGDTIIVVKLVASRNYRACAVRVLVGSEIIDVVDHGDAYISASTESAVRQAFEATCVLVSSMLRLGNAGTPPAQAATVDIARSVGPAGAYTLRKRPDGSLYVHVSSNSGAEYTVAKNPISGRIESNDKGAIFNGSSKHTDYVRSRGWL